MVFNSIEFILFFIVAFSIYWFILKSTRKGQNIFIVIASYFFYGWFDWRFLGLIIFSSFVDYFIGIAIADADSKSKKKLFLFVSILCNLGMLGIFKYYDFFIGEVQQGFYSLGFNLNFKTLDILLPVGISFYTFQTLSYSIDIYRGGLKPTREIISFFAFVSFFPQLVAGPIERAKNLLPQFLTDREFKYQEAILGSRQILWGFFKKVVIADNCAVFVDGIFDNYEVLPGWVLFLGVVLFAIQIYGDFAGYSDIAIGTARIFGFKLMQNFDTPYFAISIADLWRRWHISLSSWAMDYIFLPLSSSMKWLKRRAVMVALFLTFLILGIWHGANWTFVVFGLIHGFAVVLERALGWDRVKVKTASLFRRFGGWLYTMLIWLIGMVFFRSASVGDGVAYLKGFIYMDGDMAKVNEIFLSRTVHTAPPTLNTVLYVIIAAVMIMLLIEWYNRRYDFGLERIHKNVVVRYGSYIILLLIISEYFFGEKAFIYFQF